MSPICFLPLPLLSPFSHLPLFLTSPRYATTNSPRGHSPRANSPRANSPRANSPRANSPRGNSPERSDRDVSKGSDTSRDDVGAPGGSSSPRGFDRVMAFEGASPSPPLVGGTLMTTTPSNNNTLDYFTTILFYYYITTPPSDATHSHHHVDYRRYTLNIPSSISPNMALALAPYFYQF